MTFQPNNFPVGNPQPNFPLTTNPSGDELLKLISVLMYLKSLDDKNREIMYMNSPIVHTFGLRPVINPLEVQPVNYPPQEPVWQYNEPVTPPPRRNNRPCYRIQKKRRNQRTNENYRIQCEDNRRVVSRENPNNRNDYRPNNRNNYQPNNLKDYRNNNYRSNISEKRSHERNQDFTI